MAHIGEQIKKYRTLKGIRQIDLANKIGVTNKRLSNWERGISRPKQDILNKICEVLEIDYFDLADMDFEAKTTFDYLDLNGSMDEEGYRKYYANQTLINRIRNLDDTGQFFVLKTIEHEEKRMEQLKHKINLKTLSHPVFLMPASAGTGSFLDSDEYELVDFPEDAIPRESNFAVKVSGDSMEPDYQDGSIVFVKQTKQLEPGEVGIFIVNNEGFLKILGDHNNLISINPAYNDIKINEWDDCRLVGKVVGNYKLESK